MKYSVCFSWLILLFLFGLSLPVIGQPVFSPGEVVLNSGDTLRGFVAELSDGKRYNRCWFKRSLKGEKTTYDPQDLRSFSVTDKYYFEPRALAQSAGDTVQVFMALSLKGELQVLKYKNRIFLETTIGRRHEAPTRQNQKTSTRQEKLAAGQLKFRWFQLLFELQEDCPALQAWWEDQEKADYQVEDLVEIARGYHDCLQLPYEVFGQDIPLFNIEYGIAVSPVFSQLTFSSSHKRALEFLEEGQLSTVGVEVSIPIIFEPLRVPTYFSAYVAPIIGSYRYYADYSVQERNITFPVNYELEQSWITAGLHLGFRYRLPNIDPKLFLQAGFRREQFFNQQFNTIREQVLIREPVNELLRTEPDFGFEYFTGQMGWTSQIILQDYLGDSAGQWSLGFGYSMAWAFLSTGEIRGNVNDPGNTAARMSTFYVQAAYLW